MTQTFKKFRPLLLAGMLCVSAVPAQSAESWCSFALKEVWTWAACFGIGLGTTIVHEYGHAIVAKIFDPKCSTTIAIGSTNNPDTQAIESLNDSLLDKPSQYDTILAMHEEFLANGRGIFRPALFPEGLKLWHLVGIVEGVRFPIKTSITGYKSAIGSLAGPCTEAGFLLGALNVGKSILPKEVCLFIHIPLLINIVQIISCKKFETDGMRAQEALGMNQTLYNSIAGPVVAGCCYYAYKSIICLIRQ